MLARRRNSDLGSRVGAALVMAPLALIAIVAGGLLLDAVLLACSVVVLLEWRRMVGVQSNEKRLWAAVAAVLASGLLMMFVGDAYAFAAVLLGATVVAAIAYAEGTRPWLGIGVIYAGVMMVSLGALRGDDLLGAWALGWLFFTVWSADTFAYFSGRTLGGPKLWPRVSPNKTWSGTTGGLVGAAVMGLVFAALLPTNPSWPFVAFSVFVAMVSMAGDLFESAIKRRFKVKDASRLIPGHGGLMDRADSVVAAGIAAVLIALLRSPDDLARGVLAW